MTRRYDRTGYTKESEPVELGKFRKIEGGWQGYVTDKDGRATLIVISDSAETETHRAIVPINRRSK